MSAAAPSPPVVLAVAHTRLDDARKAYKLAPCAHTYRAVELAEQDYLTALAAADAIAEPLITRTLAYHGCPCLPPQLLATLVSATHRQQFGPLADLADAVDYPVGVMTALRQAWRRHHHREAGEDCTEQFLLEGGVGKIHACETFGDAVLLLEDQYRVNDQDLFPAHLTTVCVNRSITWHFTDKFLLLLGFLHSLPDLPTRSPIFVANENRLPPLRSSVPPDYIEPSALPPAALTHTARSRGARSRAGPSTSSGIHPALGYEQDYANEPGSSTDTTADAASTPGAHSAQSPAGGADGGAAGDADDDRASTPSAHAAQSPSGGGQSTAAGEQEEDTASTTGSHAGGADEEAIQGEGEGDDEDEDEHGHDGDAESDTDSPREGW
ncbi:hypothetical protein MSAN_02043800 [Mycena sanguinolenta]|uniref:Uncharacterized protein n=1 Tax=Mycena sanguinolenta TaxID=230812 RepID=A0A8H6XIW2_9AGAR|nr:hypothetical protein MSAN_02043800 [Mycena sanguinolenta]